MQRRSGQLIHLLYLVVKIFLTYKKPLNILHTTKRKFLSISYLSLNSLCVIAFSYIENGIAR
jgi:hypothetical protein